MYAVFFILLLIQICIKSVLFLPETFVFNLAECTCVFIKNILFFYTYQRKHLLGMLDKLENKRRALDSKTCCQNEGF